MIQFKRINTSDEALYTFMEDLMKASFPKEEYRDLNELRSYTDNKTIFYNNIIMDGDKPIGFITFWDFDDFYYAEHFAIDPNLRNGGYGKKVMNALCLNIEKPIVLEVEHPTEEIAERRINFYKRQGFELWENDYQQPPYRKGDGFLPMYIMAYGDLSKDKDYEKVKNRIYKEVYNVQ